MSATLFAEARALARQVGSDEWVSGGVGSFPPPSGAGANASGMLAMLAANDLGWVVAQLGPLQTWMDGLDSDFGGVASFAQSWEAAAAGLQGAGDGYTGRLRDVGGMSGQTIDAYVAHGEQIAEALRVQGEVVGAVAAGARLASQLVQNVHGQVQDGVAEVAAFALAVKTRSVLAGGKMTPAMMAEVTAKVAEVSGRVGPMVSKVVSVLAFFGTLLRMLLQAAARAATKAPKAAKGAKPKPKPKPKGSGKSKGKDPKKDKDAKDKNPKKHSAEKFDKKVDDLKKDAEGPKKTSKSGTRTSQYDRDGGFDQAKKDFDELTEGLEVTPEENGTLTAKLPDGRTVNVRNNSSRNGDSTLEIIDETVTPNQRTKFRYK